MCMDVTPKKMQVINVVIFSQKLFMIISFSTSLTETVSIKQNTVNYNLVKAKRKVEL